MKWILIAILIFVIMLIAIRLSDQYKDKYDFYFNLKNFLNQFKINVSFRQDKLTDFVANVKPKKQFKLFIDAYSEYLKTNKLNLSEIKILEDEEKNELTQIVMSLGKNDSPTEIMQLEDFLISVENNLSSAQENKNKLCPMIIKLSLLFAIGLAILLI